MARAGRARKQRARAAGPAGGDNLGREAMIRSDMESVGLYSPIYDGTIRQLAKTERELSRAEFQSTLPVWGATIPPYLWSRTRLISIHAPRVGSDLVGFDCGGR